jgi:cytochrome c oxidase assembly factor CtaG
MNMVVSHWSANVAVIAACLVIAAVHLAGLRALARDARRDGGALLAGPGLASPGPAGPGREVIAFYAGLAVAALALVSPLGYWSGEFIWVRSLQDILLAVVAPPLIVLGAPWLPLRRGLELALRRGPGLAVPAAPAPGTVAKRSAPRWLSWPVAVTAAFTVVWCGWHVPALYDAALRHPVVYAAEVVSYLGVGVAFWLQLIGSRPLTPRFPPLLRVMLIAGTVVTSTILGMVLGFGANVIYPAYQLVGHHHLLTVVADQQVGGAELWVLVLPSYIIAGVALLVRWLNDEESEALALGFDRLLRPPKSAWPSRTGPR